MIAVSKKSSALAIFCRFISSSSTSFDQDFVAISLLDPVLLSSLPPASVLHLLIIVFESPIIVTEFKPMLMPNLVASKHANASATNGEETLE
ncbi:hypothetical protein Goklo_002584 [Gossypium klotzschianum]|uniref:Uncharacterized protein n=1 Tax=Gossypium klotzschianum TaxID=34286 RepID=A0A7J8VUL5_9ROSI|nr:hypothetical protein [Gossypium klotzschianum]